MRTILTIATLLLTLLALAACGGSDKPCLTKAQLEDQISKVDVYSWYDPLKPDTIMRLSPENLRAVERIEDRACGGADAHYESHVEGGRH